MYVFGMGESHSIDDLLYSEDHYADPYPLWERMRHEAPVFYDKRLNAWLLTRYEDCVDAFSNHTDFSNQLYSKH
tara:strand:+ start:346 stop:567 length:222 start_codon:yes stop_codon:yes gene_type:complete